MFNPRKRSQPITFLAFLLVTSLLCGVASAVPSITLSKESGPPTSKILVSGSGFESNVGVDIFFDTKDKALVVTNEKGEFEEAGIYAPRSARPGEHWVTALERNNDKGAQTPFLVQTSWNEFHFDADGTRLNPYENVLNVDNVRSLGLKWRYPTGGYVASSPVAADGVVYIGSWDGKLYALNSKTGVKMWSFYTGDFLDTSPALANGVVYVDSPDAHLYALNAHTGALLWSVQGGDTSPAVANGVVYFGSGAGISAVKADRGKLLWKYAVPGYVYSSPTVANGVVYIGSGSDWNVDALNASTGAKLWSFTTGNVVVSSPAVANGIAYIGSQDTHLYALNASTGAMLWSFATGAQVSSSPAVANGVVYVGSQDNSVYALNANTGALLWKYTTGGPVQNSSPAVANGVVYVGSNDGNVYGLNAMSGSLLWSYTTGWDVLDSSPVVANGVVYVGSWDNNVYAFGLLGADPVKEDAGSKPPDLRMLRPDFSLKVVPSL
jgi:outer membrane protein assembly factor BamB